MAKKQSRTTKKKPAAKAMSKKPPAAAKKAPKKVTSKPTAKHAGGKPKADPNAPVPVATGPGPSVAEIGSDLVAMFNDGKFSEIEAKWWSPAIVSCEGMGVNAEWRGRKAVEAKNEWWSGENEILGAAAEGPFLGSSGFAVRFQMQYKIRATGEQRTMSEVGVYTVMNGKIIREEFMYGA